MITSYQKAKNGHHVVSARVDGAVYESMLSLASAAGYDDVSTFVREACLTKCRDIAAGLESMYSDRLKAYARR